MPAVGVARYAGHGASCPVPGEIHVWWFALDEPRGGLAATLSFDDLARAARFRSPDDRRRFMVARVVRREILSSYLGVAPAQLRFRVEEHGKPALADPSVPLRFNVSASGGLGLLGVSTAAEVGVDVELIRRDFDWRPLAADYFTCAESRALQALTGHQGTRAFFRCWTRKEAYVKARGEGLTLPLDGFEVSPDRAGSPERVGDWWVRGVEPAPDYAAAVAGAGDPPRLTCRRWGR